VTDLVMVNYKFFCHVSHISALTLF